MAHKARTPTSKLPQRPEQTVMDKAADEAFHALLSDLGHLLTHHPRRLDGQAMAAFLVHRHAAAYDSRHVAALVHAARSVFADIWESHQ